MNIEKLIDGSLNLTSIKRDLRNSLSALVVAGIQPNDLETHELREKFLKSPKLPKDFENDAIEKSKDVIRARYHMNDLSKMTFRNIKESQCWESEMYGIFNKIQGFNNGITLITQQLQEIRDAEKDRTVFIHKMGELISDIRKNCRIKRGKRGFLDRLEMTYRQRLLAEGAYYSYNRPVLRFYFQLDNIWLNVMSRDDKEPGYKIPYGRVDKDGKANKITVVFTINFRKIANYLIRRSRDTGINSLKLCTMRQVLSRSGCCSVHGIVYAKHPIHAWSRLNFPFISGTSQSAGVCFGTYEHDIWTLFHSMNIEGLAMTLRTWASYYTYGDTNPFSNISDLYRGIPKAFGSIGMRIGTDVNACRSTWANAYRDRRDFANPIDAREQANKCDEIECQLRNPNSNPCRLYREWNRIRENTKQSMAKANERKST